MTLNSIVFFLFPLCLMNSNICIMVWFEVKIPGNMVIILASYSLCVVWSHIFLLHTLWVIVIVHLLGMREPEECLFSSLSNKVAAQGLRERVCYAIIKGWGCPFFLLLCLIWNADAAENLSVGRECVEGGVEDRGQVKLKHGAQEKQRPPTFLASLHTTLVNTVLAV